MCLPIIAGVVSGIGAVMGAKAQQAGYEANAQLTERQAEIETMAGSQKALQVQDQVNRTTGAQRAGFAANGLALSGSAEDVVLDTATEGALDVATVRWNSRLASDNLKYQAKIDRMNAKTVGRSASLAFLAPVLSGAAQYAGDFARSS